MKCVKIVYEVGRGFFTSVGLEVFLRKNPVSIISFAHFSLNFHFWGFEEQPLQIEPKPVL